MHTILIAHKLFSKVTKQHTDSQASLLFSSLTLLIGILCVSAAVFGIFWLSKILPGLYTSVVGDGYAFMRNSVVFHLLWLVFFVGVLVVGIRLIISAIKKRTTDLVPGHSLYFVGASLVVIGLFYVVFEEMAYAAIAIIAGILCIYFEGAAEIT